MLDNNIDKIMENVSKMIGNSPDLSTRIIKKGRNRIGYLFYRNWKISSVFLQSNNIFVN